MDIRSWPASGGRSAMRDCRSGLDGSPPSATPPRSSSRTTSTGRVAPRSSRGPSRSPSTTASSRSTLSGPRPVRARDGVQVTVSGAVTEEVEVGMASPIELLREKSFADCSDEELSRLAALMERSPAVRPLRRTRRVAAARRGAPDLRRTLRRSLRTGGDPVERAWRRRRVRPRRARPPARRLRLDDRLRAGAAPLRARGRAVRPPLRGVLLRDEADAAERGPCLRRSRTRRWSGRPCSPSTATPVPGSASRSRPSSTSTAIAASRGARSS